MRFFYAHFYPQFYHLGYFKPQKIKGGTNMLKKFQTQEGDITIEITEKGKAIYSVEYFGLTVPLCRLKPANVSAELGH
jgi:hypothetical protein